MTSDFEKFVRMRTATPPAKFRASRQPIICEQIEVSIDVSFDLPIAALVDGYVVECVWHQLTGHIMLL
jgi:hypothetical protein